MPTRTSPGRASTISGTSTRSVPTRRLVLSSFRSTSGSHLRWDWVWQRPQPLISRIGAGRRTWFVEEPRPSDVDRPTTRMVEDRGLTRIWIDTPHDADISEFGSGGVNLYLPFLTEFFRDV